METIKISEKFTSKDYLNIDIYNSAFESIDINEILVDASIQLEVLKYGIELKVESLDKVVLDYTADDDNFIIESYDSEKLKEFNIVFDYKNELGMSNSVCIYITGIDIDVVKKKITLEINGK